MKILLAIALLIAPVHLAFAQKPPAPASSLQTLGFLSGHWTGESGGDFEEEYWSAVQGNSMVGTFRVLHGGNPVFYEFWAVELDGGKPIYKLKHFNGGLHGWEDKNDCVELPVRESDANHVVFANDSGTLLLRYERRGSELRATLHHMANGKPTEEVFLLHRAD